MKGWGHDYKIAFTWTILVALAVAGLGLMSSTTSIGIGFIRRTAASLSRLATVVSVFLLIVAFSQPIGYKGGFIFASFVAFFMVLIWICSYDKGLDFMRFVGTVMKNLWEYIKDKYSKAKESIKNKCTYASNVWGAAWGRVTKPVALAVVALATHRRDQNENQRSV